MGGAVLCAREEEEEEEGGVCLSLLTWAASTAGFLPLSLSPLRPEAATAQGHPSGLSQGNSLILFSL